MKSLAVRERPDCRVHLENENYANPEVVNLKVHKRWLVAIATVTSLAGSTLAQDVGFVTPKNQFQTELVRQVFDHAFTRCEDKYLVAFDAGQQASLEQSGIEYQILLSGADLDQTYVVRQLGHAEQAKLDVNALDKPLEISAGVYLAAMSQKAAADLTANTGWVATPLSELNIRFYYVPPAVSTMLSTLTDFPTDSLAALVSQDSLYAFDTRLEAFQTRYIWTDSIDRARDWIVQKFLNWGYTNVTTPQFYYYDWHYNVMAVKPGYAEPDKVIVVGGHYDSITYGQSPGPYEYAPGADDNASGTSTVMEMARVLANVPLRKTVIFMAFSAEEVGLVGSQAAAQDFVYNGTDIEVMYNFDMVAYTEDTYWDIEVSSGSNKAYRDLAGATASRVTSLIPVLLNAPGNSDHDSFRNQGFNIVNAIEADFNNAGWHTNLDLSSRLNFPYLTDVVKMAVASVAIVANAAHPTFVEDIIDQGDGQSLEVFWSDCDPTYQYSVQYGTSPGVYSDTVIVPAGMCSYTFSGLTEGQAYYFAVVGSAADAYPPVYTVEGSETPYMVPRAPKSFSAGPELNQIVLDWADNREADFSHYRIWRRLDGLDWSLYQDNVTSSSWIDASVVGQVNFNYRVTAVDVSGYESDFSSESGSYAGTFDGGILLVDEISQGAPLPNQATQEAYFDTVFGGTPHALTYVENISQALNRSTAGRYSS
ncbi:MAG TPA: M28 family peptidase, partial [Candidatus Deferrimicrobium sp.]|nr:M28 family peptidase [Candidatus Deferrimicrobium sp.]